MVRTCYDTTATLVGIDPPNLLRIKAPRYARNSVIKATAFSYTFIGWDAWITAVDSIPRIAEITRPRVYNKTTYTLYFHTNVAVVYSDEQQLTK